MTTNTQDCREAFEQKFKDWKDPDDRNQAWKGWKAAWNTRHTASPDVVERVARAINVADTDEQGENDWKVYINMAKAALAAMNMGEGKSVDSSAPGCKPGSFESVGASPTLPTKYEGKEAPMLYWKVANGVGSAFEKLPSSEISDDKYYVAFDLAGRGDHSCLVIRKGNKVITELYGYQAEAVQALLSQREPVMRGRCCENGNFEDAHECMKGKPTEQPDDLTARDKAFETWVNASEGYGLAFARECWNAAWKMAKSTKRESSAVVILKKVREHLVNQNAMIEKYDEKGFYVLPGWGHVKEALALIETALSKIEDQEGK